MDARSTLEATLRTERARLLAALVRRFGFEIAEEALDAAALAALEQWPRDGIPRAPRAWLLTAARRRAIDRVRHERVVEQAHADLSNLAMEVGFDDSLEEQALFPDERLRLLFTCCHPALAREAQVALALRWLSGLSTEEVARAFEVPVPTMAQRLTRAKSKIERAKIPYEVPEARELPARVGVVLEVIYAIFNEGYVATSGPRLERADLAEEALALAEMVVTLLPQQPGAHALHALLLLITARQAARISAEGDLVPLEHQDRGRWDRAMIARGQAALHRSLARGAPSAFAIEASIQALHNEAPSYAATDFPQIAALYRLLAARLDQSPLVVLNELVARMQFEPLEPLLSAFDALEPELGSHAAWAAGRAELCRRLGRITEARELYERAARASRNGAERRFLEAQARRFEERQAPDQGA